MENIEREEVRIFDAALALPPEQRDDYLNIACDGREELRARVKELLRLAPLANDFFSPKTKVLEIGGFLEIGDRSGDVIGPYRLISQLGEGGMGVVWLAEQTQPIKRKVAVKIIKVGMDTANVVARFEAERQALAIMDHPNIAKIFDGGATEKGRPYFVMELVEGVQLIKYCDEHKLGLVERLSLFMQVCKAVQHAHQKGVIHRDLKPSNILISVEEGGVVPKIIDFGIAKALKGKLTDRTIFTEYDCFLGTPAYCSPEQAQNSNADIDTRSDIYSLGVLLYEILTGYLPFTPENIRNAGIEGVLRVIREDDPPLPSVRLQHLNSDELTTSAAVRSSQGRQLINRIKGDLDWIVMKCLEKDRARRYESADALVQDLKRHLADEPVSARAPGVTYVIAKLVRRHKVVVTASVLIFLTLVGALWFSTESFMHERQAHSDALRQKEKADALAQSYSRSLYVANMNLASQACSEGNAGRMKELLSLYTRDNEKKNLRGLEWYLLDKICHSELLTLTGHLSKVNCVVYSPNGQYLASASTDKSIKIWSLAEKKELFSFMGHTGSVWKIVFSPDGRYLASASSDQTVKIWDIEKREEKLTFRGHKAPVYGLSYSPDGSWLASASEDKTVRIWNPSNGLERLTFTGHTSRVYSVNFDSTGTKLVSSGWYLGNDMSVIVWDAYNGKIQFVSKGDGVERGTVTFNRENTRVAIASGFNSVRVLDAKSGRLMLDLKGNLAPVVDVAYQVDGRRFASAGQDGLILIRDAFSGRLILPLKGHVEGVNSVAFSPDGKFLASGGSDSEIRIWDAISGPEMYSLAHYDPSYIGLVYTVAFSPDGTELASAGGDKTVRIRNAENGQLIKTITASNANGFVSLAYEQRGDLIAAGTRSGLLVVWDGKTKNEVYQSRKHTGVIKSIAFDNTGTLLATCSDDKTLRIFDSATGDNELFSAQSETAINALAYSPDGQYLVAGGDDSMLKVFDSKNFSKHCSLSNLSPIKWLAFSPDSSLVAAAGEDKSIRIWNLKDKRLVKTLKGHSGPVSSVVFTPDGNRLVSGSHDLSIKIWDTKSGDQMATLTGHSWIVYGVAINPRGDKIVSASYDTSVKIWGNSPMNKLP